MTSSAWQILEGLCGSASIYMALGLHRPSPVLAMVGGTSHNIMVVEFQGVETMVRSVAVIEKHNWIVAEVE